MIYTLNLSRACGVTGGLFPRSYLLDYCRSLNKVRFVFAGEQDNTLVLVCAASSLASMTIFASLLATRTRAVFEDADGRGYGEGYDSETFLTAEKVRVCGS